MPRADQQHLILMKGFPATGKSLLAHNLGRILRWPIVDKDDIKDFTLHLENGNTLAYEIMWAVTSRQLQLGLSAIVDSPLTYPEQFCKGQSLALDHGAHLLVVESRLSDSEWRERLDRRDRRESEHKIAGWSAMQAMLSNYDGCWRYPIPPEAHMIVDASQPVELLTLSVLSRLGIDTGEQDTFPRKMRAEDDTGIEK
jgi:predicted kinase